MKLVLLPFVALSAGLLAGASVVRAQPWGGVQKRLHYIQTSSTTPAADPRWSASFEAEGDVAYTTLTLPDSTTRALVPDGDSAYLYRYFATKALMDAAFPNGTYRLTGSVTPTPPLELTPEGFPVEIPQLVSATNGSWTSGGVFVINPTQACTLTFNTFAGYNNPNATGLISVDIEGVGNSTHLERTVATKPFGDDITVQATPLTNYTIPANTLTSGRVYTVELEYGSYPAVDISGPVWYYYGFTRKVRFMLAAVTSPTTINPINFTTQPQTQNAALGGRVTLSAAAANNSSGTFVLWFKDGTWWDIDAAGGKYTVSANRLQVTINNVTAADAGTYAVQLVNVGSSADSSVATITVPPVIDTQPIAQNVVAGGNATFSVGASGLGNTYQWRKDGAAIAGATASSLTLGSVTAANAGSYTVVITNSAGTATSGAATLTLVSASAAGRLINLSILTSLSGAGDSFTLGYVVGGAGTSGTKPLVVRVAGPSLAPLGVAGPLDDPKLELYAGAVKTGENDNWGGTADLTSAMASVGAFAFSGPNSRDAAAVVSTTSSDNSVKVSAASNNSGSVIAEIYDATPAGTFGATTRRLINVSVLKNLGSGLTAGFVIGGSTSKTVLMRAVGPTLGAAPFNVPGVVADPQLALFSGSTKIGENNDWGGTAALSAAFTQVAAFALIPGSKDAALLATLAPGSYTVQVSGVGNATGTALIEIYEVP